ncbi:hypothetical protein OHA33_18790 [Streptomyces sp. NBC_00562]|uniref:hypothetical protein n=1 Tax=Streptomyces sp. NBC_00562 TaxID=2975777 RepID=UPI002E809148|nr:hypothetical protein [Streptomyces sp. NBC_00562]WUC20750.1 hypothetical protein OHA33_18790 [Streptomyces sp. NBC_00562]
MSPRLDPLLKCPSSTLTGPGFAEPAPAASGSGAPKVVGRQAVLSSVRPDRHTVTVTGIQPGLHMRGLERGGFPIADWLCVCGHHERARGRKAVTALTTRVRVGYCPHRALSENRRNAA